MTGSLKSRIGSLLDGIPVAALAIDAAGRTIKANRKAETILGREIEDRPFVTVVRHPTVNQALEWVLGRGAPPALGEFTADPGADCPAVIRCPLAADGRRIEAEVTVSRLPSCIGKGAIVAIIDRSETEEAEQVRRDFVANVSHELRTPLTAVMGFIETLRGPARNDAPARDRFLDIMEREANRMNRLVEDLLSLSRVQSEERRRPSRPVDIAQLLRGAVATLQPAADIAGVRIDLGEFPERIEIPGESDQLVQVIQNLIENAIKYGASGGRIRVGMTRVAHEPVLRGPAWAIFVEDFGEGIDEMHVPRLTERFYRVDTHRSRAQGGTGLGLAIVKHIVNRHRGRLRIESQRGIGTQFTVYLPESLRRN